MSCSNAVECDTEQMEKDMCRRWRRYEKISSRPPNCYSNGSSQGGGGGGNGYRCKMSVNPALGQLLNSSGQIEGRVRKKNGDIMLDLSPVKPRPPSGGGSCGLSSCCKPPPQPLSQQQDIEKQRIFRKMDYLECELDAVARKLKKEIKKKIERQKQAEEEAAEAEAAAAAAEEEEAAAAAAAEEEEEEPAEGGDDGGGDEGGNDGGDNNEGDADGEGDGEEERTGKYKEVTKTVHKEKKLNDDGVEETITITTKEQVEGTGKKQCRTITTTEEHKTPGGGGYTIVTTEKTVKGGKHNEYKMIKKEKIKSRDDDSDKDGKGGPKCKHREKTEDVTYDDEGKRHEIKIDTTESKKGQKQKVKKIVETKDEGEDGNVVYEKTITKTKEEPDKNKC